MLNIIQEYRNNFEEIFEKSFDYIYLHDKEGNILDVNDVVVRNLGYSKEKILNMNVTDFLVEEVISEVSSAIKKTMETGVVNKPKTYKVRKKDGTFIYVEGSAIPLKKNDEIYSILGIGHDVTAFKELEQKLMESEERYRHLFEHSPFTIMLFDEKGNFIESNRTLIKKLSDYAKIDFTGKNFLEIASHFQNSKELIRIFLERFKNLREGTLLEPIEFFIITNNGKKVWLHWQSSKIEIGEKTFIQVIIQDITEQKKAEEKLRESEKKYREISHKLEQKVNERTKELKLSEEKYRELFNGMSSGVAVYETLDEGNTFIFKDMNPSGEKISRVKKDDIIGKNVLDLFPKVKSAGLLDTFKEVYKYNMPKRHPISKYGDEMISHWAENYVYKLPTGEIVAVYDDLTELKITEQKLKQLTKELEQKIDERAKELKESEENYRLITENSNDLIRVLNDRFEIEFINETTHLKILGYSKKDLIGKIDIFLNHPEDYTSIRRFMRNVFKTGEGTHESRMRHRNGKWVWFEVKAKILEDERGNTKYLLISRDITERKQAEEVLKESEKRLKDFIQNATDSISIWDSNLNLIEMNKVAAERWNVAKETLIGKNMSEINPSIKETGMYDKYMEVIKTGEPVSFNNIMMPSNQEERYFDIKSFKVGNGLGVIGNEITESIKAEQKLKESEEKFRNIAEQSFMGIVIIQEGELKYMNKAISKISGYPVEEIPTWSEKEIARAIYPNDLNIILKRLQSNIEGTMGPFSHNTFRIINKNGEVRWLEDYTSRIIYQGRPANLISIIDITDKKEAEQLIIEENKRLLELDDLRKDLIIRVSHELKTPMTSIYGANQILTQLYIEEIGEEAQKYIEIGYRGCLRLKQLIDNLLDVSRLDAKKFDLKLQKENLVELTIDCVKDMSYLASNRQLKMKLELPEEAYLDVDRLRFRQVLTNIISNAIKNTPKDGEIFIKLIEKANNIDIHIKDTGVGLTEKEKEKLFEKFGKIERYGMDLGVDIEGSGLGLYISKEIVKLHGGQIFVESEGRHKGSAFTIRLIKN